MRASAAILRLSPRSGGDRETSSVRRKMPSAAPVSDRRTAEGDGSAGVARAAGSGGGNGHDAGALVAVGPGDDASSEGVAATSVLLGGEEPSSLVRGVVGEPPIARADTFGLSPREREVLLLI